jgi:hypothetical protein
MAPPSFVPAGETLTQLSTAIGDSAGNRTPVLPRVNVCQHRRRRTPAGVAAAVTGRADSRMSRNQAESGRGMLLMLPTDAAGCWRRQQPNGAAGKGGGIFAAVRAKARGWAATALSKAGPARADPPVDHQQAASPPWLLPIRAIRATRVATAGEIGSSGASVRFPLVGHSAISAEQ